MRDRDIGSVSGAARSPRLREGTIVDRFEVVRAQYPDSLAIADECTRLTYADVGLIADRVRDLITAARTHESGPVGVFFPHDAMYPAAILGTLAAGCCCVPMDVGHPEERNRLIAGDAGLSAVVTRSAWVSAATALVAPGVPIIDVDGVEAPITNGDTAAVEPEDLAFIVYTSGSTGVPKGVFQNHRGALRDVLQSVASARIGIDDKQTMFYSPSIIAGLRTALSSLLTGASLQVLSPAELGAERAALALKKDRPTIVRCSPTLFRYMADALHPDDRFDSVRLVMLGGERIDWSDLDVFKRACLPHAELGVHLGATECWTLHSEWMVDESLRDDAGRLPVGRPSHGREIAVVDENGVEVPDGQVGECWVTSSYLALGYWGDAKSTARKFGEGPGGRTYRTGDLVVRRPDGLLEHVGRKDQQLKLAGRRVELSEIEVALKACPGVYDGALIVRRTDNGEPRSLVAYVERSAGFEGLLSRHVKAILMRRLPRYMLPSVVNFVERLPRLPSFKVDRSELARMDEASRLLEAGPTDGEVLAAVVAVCEEVLERERVSPEESISSLGGDSLQVISIATRLENRLGVRVPIDVVEAQESISELARWIARERASTDGPFNTSVSRAANRPLDRPKISRAKALERRRRNVSEWTDAIDRLLNQGQLDEARCSAADLCAVYPELSYGDSVSTLLERVPSEDGRYLSFSNDPRREIQVVTRLGTKTMVILFCGNRQGLGVPLPVMHQWFGALPATLVYLRDFRKSHYYGGLKAFGADRNATLSGLSDLARRVGAEQIACFGVSSGLVAALYYGLDLGARTVVGCSGPLNFTRDFNLYLRTSWVAARLRTQYPKEIVDLRHAYRQSAARPETTIVYADNHWDDRLHAEYMNGTPGVTLVPLERCRNHNVVLELIRRGQLASLVAKLV